MNYGAGRKNTPSCDTYIHINLLDSSLVFVVIKIWDNLNGYLNETM